MELIGIVLFMFGFLGLARMMLIPGAAWLIFIVLAFVAVGQWWAAIALLFLL